MIAFLVAGLILGTLARTLKGDPDDPSVLLTATTGVVGAVVGGVGINLLLSEGWQDLNAFSFSMACILAVILLGLLEAGVGRSSSVEG